MKNWDELAAFLVLLQPFSMLFGDLFLPYFSISFTPSICQYLEVGRYIKRNISMCGSIYLINVFNRILFFNHLCKEDLINKEHGS